MSVNQTPMINLTTGGTPVQVPVLVLNGPNSDQPDPAATIAVSQGSTPVGIATITVHPTDPRAVIVTPGASAGVVTLFVSSSPSAAANLQVNVTVTTPPSVRQVFYDSARGFGPVQ